MEDTVDIEALKARLNVCRQQLESNSLINTRTRKDALRQEINSIEMKLANALGIKDDDDDDEAANHRPAASIIEKEKSTSSIVKCEDDTATSESQPRPHINSLSHTPLPSSQSGASGSGAGMASLRTGEAESIRSALVDAGEGDIDLETLLKEQAMMEQRLADLKRRREVEDEAFARSLHVEEMKSIRQPQTARPTQTSTTTSSYSSSSSSQTNPWSFSQSKSAKSHQERMDEEMAKLLAESEDNVFDLAQSPKKTQQPPHNVGNLPTQPSFSIFEKKIRTDPPSASSSIVSTGAAPGSNGTANTLLVNGLSNQITPSQILQNHAQSILSMSSAYEDIV